MPKDLMKADYNFAQQAREARARQRIVEQKKRAYEKQAYTERYQAGDRYKIYDTKVGYLYYGKIVSLGLNTFRIEFMQANGSTIPITVKNNSNTTMNKRYWVWKLDAQMPVGCPMR